MTAPWKEKGPSAPRVEHKNYTDEPENKYSTVILTRKTKFGDLRGGQGGNSSTALR